MARNLSRKKIKRLKDIVEFYYKRSKRIVPLYYLIILISTMLVHLSLPECWWFSNQRYSLSSLFLVTNHLIISDSGNYFNEFLTDGSSLNAFIHLWSLSVEMQFYFLAPLVFYGLQFLENKKVVITLTTIIGCAFSTLLNPQFAFNFMLLRFWQFSAGFMALYLPRVTIRHHDDLIIVALSVIALCMIPTEINVLILRPLVTFSTAFIVASRAEERDKNKFLQCYPLVFLGNISYVVYLVHWPIIVIYTGTALRNQFFCVVTALISSILLHHLFEKHYLTRLGTRPIILLILALFTANLFLQFSVRAHTFWKPKYTKDVQDIVDRNMRLLERSWSVRDDTCIGDKLEYPNIDVLAYCHYPKGLGNVSIMMMGNSYVQNFDDPIRAHFHNNYSDYRSYAILSNLGTHSVSSASRIALEMSWNEVAKHKPDVLFIVARE
ncbi:unnamed protein product [Caenorhabditis sp. 36 PRJEB53466]|nr:unnamed protein product [Caenorhabditis sp. 36 PRJEB53466]